MKPISNIEAHTETHDQGYGDLTELNCNGSILKSIGRERLECFADDYMDLLGTSSAIYEANGDYALGIFTSGWCRMLDRASRRLCNTPDDTEALDSGCWLCHESCWTDCSKRAIAECAPVDIECHGGIRTYAVPILAQGDVVGAINFGYGEPPKDPEKLRNLAKAYHLDYDDLVREADAYDSRPSFIIELAKKRLHSTAWLIGSMIETKQAENALQESEKKFRRIAENMTDVVWITDLEMNPTYISPSVERVLGIKPEDYLQLPITQTYPPASIEKFKRTLTEEFAKERDPESDKDRIFQLEVERYYSDGTIGWDAISAGFLRDEQMNPIAVQGVSRDITERVKAEEALRKSEATIRNKLKAILDPDGDIGTLNLADIIDSEELQDMMEDFNKVSKIGGAILDVSGKVLVGIGWQDICKKFHRTHPDSAKNCLESDLALASGVPGGTFKAYRCKNSMWDMVSPIKVGEKHLGNIYIGQYFYEDERLDYELFRKQARQYGFDETEYLAALDRVPRLKRETVESAMKFYAKLAAIISSLSYSKVKLSRDITERKRAEAERGKMQAQLTQAQKMESVGRLAGGVAHDFNNMLGVILGHTEMALEHVDPGQPLFNDLQEIRKAAERSANLTRQLLTFARKQTIAPRVINLNETVEGMLKMLRRLIGENIDLTWLPGKNLAPVKVDPSQIDQILANLCVNARDAIAGVGKLTIETGRVRFDEEYCADHAGFTPGEFIMLAVSDNGCGMDQETIGHLFEPFFTTKELGKGTGLGLASVYGTVKQNNGFINVYSEPGQGTTVKIYLPQHPAGEPLQADKAPAKPTAGGSETILLVEDEPAILHMATRMLEKLGYVVIVADTPGEAIRLAREHSGPIDLLMTDVVMPEMNGRDLAKNLLSIYPNIKRLFMSGYTADVIAHHGVLDKGVHFIQKPFSSKDLGAKLCEILEDKNTD